MAVSRLVSIPSVWEERANVIALCTSSTLKLTSSASRAISVVAELLVCFAQGRSLSARRFCRSETAVGGGVERGVWSERSSQSDYSETRPSVCDTLYM